MGLWFLAAVGFLIGAVRAEGSADRWLNAATVVGCGLLAWRASRVRLVVTETAITDVRTFVTRRYDWSEVRGVGVARPRGLLDGLCLTLASSDGQEVPLLATRVYSFVPSRGHVQRLHEMVTELRSLQPAPAG